jgi:tight adherence protein B
MDLVLIAVLALLGVGTLVVGAIALGVPIPGLPSGKQDVTANLRNLSSAQRQQSSTARMARSGTARAPGAVAIDLGGKKSVTSKLTLTKKLRYAQLNLSPAVYHFCWISISLVATLIAFFNLNIVFQLVALSTGWLFMGWLVTLRMSNRFKEFDADYPQFLLSVVSLLKTGMNVMSALETSAKGLEEGSLTRSEVELMVERLRYGVSEDKSIGAFGEDIYHPEIELFVQALLLSRRVGGTLSDTLERLAKQVRRRQFFRSSAAAAVSMQRGSIWFIIAILIAMESYLYVVYPDVVLGSLRDELGWQIWQVAMLLIIGGIFWVRQITKIRI